MIDEGNALQKQGRFVEALVRYDAAVRADPQSARAHLGRGNALVRLGRTADAMEAYRHALAIQPSYADAQFNLGILLMSRGDYAQAAQLLARAIESAPNLPTQVAFAHCAARTRFMNDEPQVRAALTAAISEAWAMPHDLCRPALSLIALDQGIARCIRIANESWPARMPRAVLFGPGALGALAADTLLHTLLETVSVNSIHFERFLTCARHVLLGVAYSKEGPDTADIGALKFYAALARQCFINEYVFECLDSERLEAAACRESLLTLLDAGATLPPFLLLAVAAYSPLHLLPGAERLLGTGDYAPIDGVLRQQVREPIEEQRLRAGIERLTPIAGGVSEAVRNQYEESPYPRWVKMQMPASTLHFNDELHRALPFAAFTPMSDDTRPEVLIAGCGTGSDAIFVAGRFRGSRVLGIDLSLSSISYAKRKTQELGLTNIDYAQADILKIGDIVRRFDVISAIGVLHHLADPFNGWRILLSLLRPGGFMCLGLYSRLARRHLVRAREFIAERGYTGTPDDVRRFRQDVLAQDAGAELRSLSNSQSFFSLSDCRDLAFHVQEQHLTLAQIESFLADHGLQFLGFELDLRILDQYRTRFAEDPNCISLSNWANFEAENPDTFSSMYRFWIHQPVKDVSGTDP
jgi:2-polyprenyl-3-methyl-5-hydroxy-6-metoxy-1,4-benzoquinol methylase